MLKKISTFVLMFCFMFLAGCAPVSDDTTDVMMEKDDVMMEKDDVMMEKDDVMMEKDDVMMEDSE